MDKILKETIAKKSLAKKENGLNYRLSYLDILKTINSYKKEKNSHKRGLFKRILGKILMQTEDEK